MRRVALALLISQVGFWGLLASLEYLAQPARGDQAHEVELRLPANDAAPGETRQLVMLDEPAYKARDSARRPHGIFVYRFDLTTPEPMALYVSFTRRIVEYRVNGHILRPELGDETWGTISGFEPTVIAIPARFLQSGENELHIKVVGGSLKILPMFALGGIDEMFEVHAWGKLFTVDLVYVSIGVMAFVSLLICFMGAQAENPQRLWMLVFLMAVWSFRNACFLGLDSYVPVALNDEFHYGTTFTFLAVILGFTVVWLNMSSRFLGVIAVVWAISIGVLFAPWDTRMEEFQRAYFMETLLTIVSCGLAMGLLIFRLRKEGGFVETCIFTISFMTILVDALDDRFWLQIHWPAELYLTFYVGPLGGLLLALGMAANLARQSLRAQQLTKNLNAELTQRLREREVELESVYEEREKLRAQQAVDSERERIVRDMHDGLSGQLTGLLAISENETVERAEISDGIRHGIRDLRLIVQSLDGASDNLVHALGTFRARVQRELQAAGISLIWNISNDVRGLVVKPDALLNIHRFLQEAINNAMRHSHADCVEVDIGVLGERLVLSVADSGQGLAGVVVSAAEGMGLNNMELRARRLGGTLEKVANCDLGGAMLRLDAPLSEIRA